MSTAAAARRIICFGIRGSSSPDTSGWTPDKVRAAMEEQARAARAAGYDITIELVDPDPDRGVMEANISRVRALLAEREVDGVAIGFGLRGRQELSWLFQGCVNAVVEVSQDKGFAVPRMVFPLLPTKVFEAVVEEFERVRS